MACWRHGRARAVDVQAGAEGFDVRLEDGRRIYVPYSWFPRLEAATPLQRGGWQLIGRGIGIHWPDIDEDLSIDGLLHGTRAPAASDLPAGALPRTSGRAAHRQIRPSFVPPP